MWAPKSTSSAITHWQWVHCSHMLDHLWQIKLITYYARSPSATSPWPWSVRDQGVVLLAVSFR